MGLQKIDALGVGMYEATPGTLADGEATALNVDNKGRAVARLSDAAGNTITVPLDGQAGTSGDGIMPMAGYDGANYRRIATDSSGRVITVPVEAGGVEEFKSGAVAGSTSVDVNSDPITEITPATISVSAGVVKSLRNITVSCRQYSEFKVVSDDGTTVTEICKLVVPQGGGSVIHPIELGGVKVTGSATMKIKVLGVNLGQPSGPTLAKLNASLRAVTL